MPPIKSKYRQRTGSFGLCAECVRLKSDDLDKKLLQIKVAQKSLIRCCDVNSKQLRKLNPQEMNDQKCLLRKLRVALWLSQKKKIWVSHCEILIDSLIHSVHVDIHIH